MKTLIFAALFAVSASANSFNLSFYDGFEGQKGMASTSARRPVLVHVGFQGSIVNTQLRDAFGGFNGSSQFFNLLDATPAVINVNPSDRLLYPGESIHLVYSWIPGAPLADTITIPAGSIVTGVEFATQMSVTARDGTGQLIELADSGVVTQTLEFFSSTNPFSGVATSGSIGNGNLLPHQNTEVSPGVPAFNGDSTRYGGPLDDWGSPAISSAPTAYTSSTFRIHQEIKNTGTHGVYVYLLMASVVISYQPTTTIVMEGTGTTTADAERGIKITSAMVGAGVTAMAANSVSQNRKITASMVGKGLVDCSVRLDNAGAISVYGFASMVGSGEVSVPTVTRVIPIPAPMVGSGTTDVTVQRGIVLAIDPLSVEPEPLIQGYGETTATVLRLKPITAAMVGAGVVVGAITRQIKLTAAMVGAGVTTGAVFVHRTINAAFVGTGNVVAIMRRGIGAAVALVGSGTVDATPQRGKKLTAAMVGTGVVDAGAYTGSTTPASPERRFIVPGIQTTFVVPGQETTFVVPS